MLRFLWRATRGYRLSPWRSPYLRWRMETYWGVPATEIQFGFLAICLDASQGSDKVSALGRADAVKKWVCRRKRLRHRGAGAFACE